MDYCGGYLRVGEGGYGVVFWKNDSDCNLMPQSPRHGYICRACMITAVSLIMGFFTQISFAAR